MLLFRSKLLTFDYPIVMGIVNVTPDSFALRCASLDREGVLSECARQLAEGADILDIGACSTRPGSVPVDEQEEWQRLEMALGAIREVYPDILLSLDTFRASVAQRAIERFHVNMINDVSGLSDPDMASVVARARVPYVLTHTREGRLSELVSFFSFRLDTLHRAGVTDVLLDPGFGFGKSQDTNYALLHYLKNLHCFNAPILVGVSRKSMVYSPLGITPAEALNGTTAVHVLALLNGANVLRVHDVKAAQEAIQIVQLYQNNN